MHARRPSITIGYFSAIKSHLVLIWLRMNRASSAAATRVPVTALRKGGRVVGVLTMSPLLLREGIEARTYLHAAVQRSGRTQRAPCLQLAH